MQLFRQCPRQGAVSPTQRFLKAGLVNENYPSPPCPPFTRLGSAFRSFRAALGPVPVASARQQGLVQLGDLPADEWLQGLLQPVVVPLQLPLVLLLVRSDQTLVLP